MIVELIVQFSWCLGPLLVVGLGFLIFAIGKGNNNQIH